MTAVLHIEHPISAFEDWKAAFDRFAPLRRTSGVAHERIHRPLDDDRYVVVELEFATAEQARRFLGVLETEVWSSRDRSPALAGTPRTRILEVVPSSESLMR